MSSCMYTVDLLNVFGVSLEVWMLLTPICCNLKRKLLKFVIDIASHYFALYYTVMHVLLEAYNIYIHRFTLEET